MSLYLYAYWQWTIGFSCTTKHGKILYKSITNNWKGVVLSRVFICLFVTAWNKVTKFLTKPFFSFFFRKHFMSHAYALFDHRNQESVMMWKSFPCGSSSHVVNVTELIIFKFHLIKNIKNSKKKNRLDKIGIRKRWKFRWGFYNFKNRLSEISKSDGQRNLLANRASWL